MTQHEILPPPIRCEFSDCRRYRYVWELVWDRARAPCAFIGLAGYNQLRRLTD